MVYFTYAQHFSGTFMPIIRSLRLYVCYYRLWCAVPWLLVVGGQMQGSRLGVRDEGCCSSNIPHPGPIVSALHLTSDQQQTRHCTP